MVIKSKMSKDHLKDMEEIFEVFRKFQMKFNPLKCAFRVLSGQFLGHFFSRRGIEPNPTQIRTLSEIKEPRTIQDVKILAYENAVKTLEAQIINFQKQQSWYNCMKQ